MNHITVGIDGSAGSARALEWAAAEAAASGSELHIVHALNVPATGGIYRHTRPSTPWVTELEKFSRELLDTAARHVAEIAPDVDVSTQTLKGPAAAVLVHASRDAHAVVVGSRGLGALEGFIGSVSLKVATGAGCPVIVIPDRDTEPGPDGPIVVGVDDSPFSVAGLRFALQEALLHGTWVRAVYAYQLPMISIPIEPGVMSGFEQASHDEAMAMVDKVIGEARTEETRDVKIESVVLQGPTVESMLDYAGDARLIVVGSHGRGVVRRLLLGSVSRRLLLETDRPVAVVDLPH